MLTSLKSGNRLRVDYSKHSQQIDIPNLLQLQQNSFETFLMTNSQNREKAEIEKVFKFDISVLSTCYPNIATYDFDKFHEKNCFQVSSHIN